MGAAPQRFDRALVVGDAGGAGWAKAQIAEIAAALQFIGIKAVALDVEAALLAIKSLPRDSFFVVDANNRLDIGDRARKFSFMVDHPCQLLKRVRGDELRSTIFGWVDASHSEGIAAIGVEAHSIFLPHAGPDPTPKPLPMQERDIDVFFAGGLGETVERSAWLAQRPGTPEILADVIFTAASAAETTLDPILDIFAASCVRHGLDISASFSRPAFCTVIGEILRIAETNRRNAVLEALPDVTVCVVSEYLPVRFRDRPNIRHLPYTDDFDSLRRLMARSKLVLNTTCKFPSGSHERIWFGMAEGAAILTDASHFMQRSFRHAENIFYLPQSRAEAGHLAYLGALVKNPAALDAVAQNAVSIYAKHHTWKRRISWLNAAVQHELPTAAATPSAIAASAR